MIEYIDCWQQAAVALFSQACAGEPQLAESLPKPLDGGAFGWSYVLSGSGPELRFSVWIDAGVLDIPLMGEGVEQKSAWAELLREVADSGCGELLTRTGQKMQVTATEETAGEGSLTRAFALRTGDKSFPVMVSQKQVQMEQKPAVSPEPGRENPPRPNGVLLENDDPSNRKEEEDARRRELLLDLEIETTLRFGCRELPIAEILELGPGDVVPLDRQVTDPVDLVVGDKIVARGEVVLINGNFGLRITEVAEARMRLETIRCLF